MRTSGRWLTIFLCAAAVSSPCWASKAKKLKTRTYRNEASGFCAEVPANWNGPAEVPNHAGGRFDAPADDAFLTFALSPNQSKSIVMGQKDAGSQMAVLDDYREAIPNTWRSDHEVSAVKVIHEDSATLDGAPALRIELAYRRAGDARRYEIVFALSNNEQFAVEYDAAKRTAKRYESYFEKAVSSFAFQCSASGQ